MSYAKSSSLHHKIAYLGLFAILLLTFGPVISQVQAVLLLNNPVAPHHMNHHKYMVHQTTDKISNLSADIQKPQTDSKPHHLMSLCGYCDLVNHSPIITIYTPITTQASPIQLVTFPLHLVDYPSPSYSSALSRAPPFK